MRRKIRSISKGSKRESYILGYTVGNVSKRTGESRAAVRRWLKKQVINMTPCPFCGTELRIGNFAVDHKDPISRGGSARLSNCWTTCQPCNRAKGDLTVEEFHALVAFLKSQNTHMYKSVLARLKIAGAMYR